MSKIQISSACGRCRTKRDDSSLCPTCLKIDPHFKQVPCSPNCPMLHHPPGGPHIVSYTKASKNCALICADVTWVYTRCRGAAYAIFLESEGDRYKKNCLVFCRFCNQILEQSAFSYFPTSFSSSPYTDTSITSILPVFPAMVGAMTRLEDIRPFLQKLTAEHLYEHYAQNEAYTILTGYQEMIKGEKDLQHILSETGSI